MGTVRVRSFLYTSSLKAGATSSPHRWLTYFKRTFEPLVNFWNYPKGFKVESWHLHFFLFKVFHTHPSGFIRLMALPPIIWWSTGTRGDFVKNRLGICVGKWPFLAAMKCLWEHNKQKEFCFNLKVFDFPLEFQIKGSRSFLYSFSFSGMTEETFYCTYLSTTCVTSLMFYMEIWNVYIPALRGEG